MAGRGGSRPGAGRKAKPKIPLEANKRIATEVLALTKRPIHVSDCECELCRWWHLLNAKDERLRFDVLKYLTDRRDGKAVQAIQHSTDNDQPLKVIIEHIGPPNKASAKAK